MTMKKVLPGVFAAAAMVSSAPVRADFTYTESTQITGGSMVGMMKMVGTFSKQARQAGEPVISTVIVKGNRMTRISQDRTEIIDLDKGTVTEIDKLKHEYTVMTFEQMKQQMDAAMAKAKQQQQEQKPTAAPAQPTNTDVKFQVHVRNTGATKEVAGLNANESILTMAMDATDKTSGQTGSLGITTDMWLAPEIPGYDEVREFYKRYALKMGTVFSGSEGMYSGLFAAHPGAQQGMSDMAKEVSKMQGIPVLQIMRMGPTMHGEALPAASEAPLPASDSPAMPSAGDVAQQTATSAIASKLGALGGFGGFGRKKQQAAPASAPAGDAAAGATANVLMESTTKLAGFSQAAVEASVFEVPAGFQQVQLKGVQ